MLLQGNQSEQPKRDPKQEIVHLQMRIGSSFSLAASEEIVKSVLPPSNRLTSRHHTRTTAKIDDLQPAATTTNQGHHGRKSRTRSDQPTRTQHTKQNKKKKNANKKPYSLLLRARLLGPRTQRRRRRRLCRWLHSTHSLPTTFSGSKRQQREE